MPLLSQKKEGEKQTSFDLVHWSNMPIFFYLFYGKSKVAIPGSMSSSMSEMQLGSDIFQKYCRAEPKLRVASTSCTTLVHHPFPWPGRECRDLDKANSQAVM